MVSIPVWLGLKNTGVYLHNHPDSKVHEANMGPTRVLSASDGPHVGPMNLAIRAMEKTLKLICGYMLIKFLICRYFLCKIYNISLALSHRYNEIITKLQICIISDQHTLSSVNYIQNERLHVCRKHFVTNYNSSAATFQYVSVGVLPHVPFCHISKHPQQLAGPTLANGFVHFVKVCNKITCVSMQLQCIDWRWSEPQ